MVAQVCRRLHHTPRVARGAHSTALAGKGHEVVVPAIVALAVKLACTGQVKPRLIVLGYGLVEQRALWVTRGVELGLGDVHAALASCSDPANPWGLQDMHGNIFEWVQDTWHDNYAHAPLTGDTAWEGGDQDYRVTRGGCWHSNAKLLRSAQRDWDDSGMCYYDSFGFRVMRTLP